ncbi:hypothetical protein N9H70_11000 [Pseudomonadales bacterium]|nr:hypothetical protein [Pseudomonadales bacterium]
MNESILDLIGPIDSVNCYEERMQNLRAREFDTSLIEGGIADTLKVIAEGAKSFVVYGEPQSGKTEFMIALTCKLLDEGFETIFVVMNDNTELESQNYDRFITSPELNPSPVREFELYSLSAKELGLRRKRIIFCRKNSLILDKLLVNARFMKKRVVIDDEADFASPNTKINKKDISKINDKVGSLIDAQNGGIYIGVTATPGRLDLNNTFANDTKNWVFLRSHKNYKGRSFFFPLTEEQLSGSDYNLTLMPDEGDNPKLLRTAIYRFLLRVAKLNSSEQVLKGYSMLIHTAGKTLDHEEDKRIVDDVMLKLSDHSGTGRKYLAEMYEEANLTLLDETQSQKLELLKFVLKNVDKRKVLIINHKQDSGNVLLASKPTLPFTFAIGGNIVSRGLTFERLLTFFFSRNVKGKMQQNTYIQRARMFGNRPYSKYFELCAPTSLYENWAECFQDHETSLRLAKSGEALHIEGSKNRASDSASIDKTNVAQVVSGERSVGEIFSLDAKLEQELLNCETDPLNGLKALINLGKIPQSAFSSAIMDLIEETSRTGRSDTGLVFRSSPRDGKFIQSIEQYTDGDPVTITRARGGMIQAILNRRDYTANKSHYILPVKNDRGQARFYYRNELSKKVLQNQKKRG